MGLIEEFEKRLAQATTEAAEALLAEQADLAEIATRRAKIVHEHIRTFAAQHGADFVELEPIRGARYFAVDNLVLVVRPHGNVDKAKQQTAKPNEVLWHHTVALVGYNITDQICETGKGTLILLSFASIERAYAAHRHDLQFALEEVVKRLYPQ